LIVSNNQIKFKNYENISLINDFKKDQGPLGGVLSAMKWAKEKNNKYEWISTFPVDTPFFKKEILQKFLSEINSEESKLFFIKSNNTRHNIFGIWSIDLMKKLEDDLNEGQRKVEVWANSVGVKIINMEFINKDPFFNINTKEDLEKAKEKINND
jgi:molybdopterin-guanine dinucleotide biosynthesis protein A